VHGILIAACGLVPLLTPLVVWAAWSPPVFWLIMAAGGAALLTIHVLIWTFRDEDF